MAKRVVTEKNTEEREVHMASPSTISPSSSPSPDLRHPRMISARNSGLQQLPPTCLFPPAIRAEYEPTLVAANGSSAFGGGPPLAGSLGAGGSSSRRHLWKAQRSKSPTEVRIFRVQATQSDLGGRQQTSREKKKKRTDGWTDGRTDRNVKKRTTARAS